MQISTSVVWCSDVVVNILFFIIILTIFAIIYFDLLFLARLVDTLLRCVGKTCLFYQFCGKLKSGTIAAMTQNWKSILTAQSNEDVSSQTTAAFHTSDSGTLSFALGLKHLFFSSTGKCCQRGENIFREAPP